MLIHSPEVLSQFIREQRKQQKLSQSQVAETVGLMQATISDFENKPEGTRIETLFRILAATNVELHLVAKTDAQSEWDQPW